MNEFDRGPRRPTQPSPRAITRSRRILDSAWAAIAAVGLIMLVTALAALAGSSTTPT
jgi:hypothetical protein